MAQPIPLQHTAKAFNDARVIGNPRVLGEPSAVFARTTRVPRDDTPQHVRQADNLRRFYAANHRLDGPPRHVRIEPRIDWPTVLAWWALALSLGCIVYFGGQLLRAVLS